MYKSNLIFIFAEVLLAILVLIFKMIDCIL
nr:MAG TPA: hypothetical protein [Caudoviricetes sp.]